MQHEKNEALLAGIASLGTAEAPVGFAPYFLSRALQVCSALD
jgi:hypothetical protein